MHRAHDLCVRRRVAYATTRGHTVWDLSAYPTGPAHRYRRPRAPHVSDLFFVPMISLRGDFIMMFLEAYALQDEPKEESGYHKLGRGA